MLSEATDSFEASRGANTTQQMQKQKPKRAASGKNGATKPSSKPRLAKKGRLSAIAKVYSAPLPRPDSPGRRFRAKQQQKGNAKQESDQETKKQGQSRPMAPGKDTDSSSKRSSGISSLSSSFTKQPPSPTLHRQSSLRSNSSRPTSPMSRLSVIEDQMARSGKKFQPHVLVDHVENCRLVGITDTQFTDQWAELKLAEQEAKRDLERPLSPYQVVTGNPAAYLTNDPREYVTKRTRASLSLSTSAARKSSRPATSLPTAGSRQRHLKLNDVDEGIRTQPSSTQ